MHRFGRSAQQKMKDRWGGSFILATLLALVAAWFAGTWLNENWGKGSTASTSGTASPTDMKTTTGDPMPMASMPAGDFKLYFVQVGAFRSESGARDVVKKLNDKGVTAMMSPRSSSGLVTVYGGVYTTTAGANDAKLKLMSDAGMDDAIVKPVAVMHNPTAIPAVAMNDGNLRQAVDAMNGYLFEVAAYMESGHPADVSGISSKGKDLAKVADTLNKVAAKDPTLKAVADLATTAAANAAEFETAAKAGASAAELQTAVSHYLGVISQYNTLSTATPATAPAPSSKSSSGSTNSSTNTGH